MYHDRKIYTSHSNPRGLGFLFVSIISSNKQKEVMSGQTEGMYIYTSKLQKLDLRKNIASIVSQL